MIRLYYTVRSGYNASQMKISNSLGGYKSSTPVPNDVFNNIFDELSLNTIANNKSQYIALVLKNEGEEIVSNVNVWFTPKGENVYCDYTIGATKMLTDNEGNPIMESVETIYSKPFQIQLYPATEENKATIGDIQPNEEIGLWICRTVDSDVVLKDYDNVAERDFNTENRYKPVIKDKEESIDFNIVWD